ncbi:hypothetical protein [Dyadobacter psychrotolerans]|uniref:Uncharacterized protein n=1 Tax=Dyadobacter psychrotolerans TaxID=2541721 RepID=A0A4R5DLV9_9BACT|nr:hypothetical protein [Dyadobacter psychrotolerans]TDE15246.1 hypothetical protein E0F88_12030 [Dyadobacter psychrotolerans]
MYSTYLIKAVSFLLCFSQLHILSPEKPSVTLKNQDLVLNKTITALNSIKKIKYQQKLSINSATSGKSTELMYDIYIEFLKEDPIIGFKFYQDAIDHSTIYDGTKLLSVDKKRSKKNLIENPNKSNFKSLTFLFNSIITIRSNLLSISKNENIEKDIKTIHLKGKDLYSISFVLKNSALDRLGGIMATNKNEIWNYEILVDQKTFIPVEVRQSDIRNKDYYITTFSDIEIDKDYGYLISKI